MKGRIRNACRASRPFYPPGAGAPHPGRSARHAPRDVPLRSFAENDCCLFYSELLIRIRNSRKALRKSGIKKRGRGGRASKMKKTTLGRKGKCIVVRLPDTFDRIKRNNPLLKSWRIPAVFQVLSLRASKQRRKRRYAATAVRLTAFISPSEKFRKRFIHRVYGISKRFFQIKECFVAQREIKDRRVENTLRCES